MNWIKIEDALPEDYKTNVLCFVEHKRLGEDKVEHQMHVGHLLPNSKDWIVGNYFSWDIGKITHWRPLPEPPKIEVEV